MRIEADDILASRVFEDESEGVPAMAPIPS